MPKEKGKVDEKMAIDKYLRGRKDLKTGVKDMLIEVFKRSSIRNESEWKDLVDKNIKRRVD